MPKIQMIRLKVSANTIPFKSIYQFYCGQEVSEPVPLDTEGHCKCKSLGGFGLPVTWWPHPI